MKKAYTTKKGAASFYIVAFSTLILVIIAASFATAIINDIMRTSNDDLSQSAYDAALAGVEDAKVAFLNYQRCKEQGKQAYTEISAGPVTCEDIMYWMAHPDCLMVGHILGRIKKEVTDVRSDGSEVLVSDTVKTSGVEKTNNLQQAYTCVKINVELDDIRDTLTSTSNTKVVRAGFDSDGEAGTVRKVKLKWYPKTDQTGTFNYSHIMNPAPLKVGNKQYDWRVGFFPVTEAKSATPPAIQIELLQTAKTFSIEDFTKVVRKGGEGPRNKTDRGTIVMVPTNDAKKAHVCDYDVYDGSAPYADANYQWWGAYNNPTGRDCDSKTKHSGENFIPSRWFVDSNAAGGGYGGQNPAYLVYCPENSSSEFACEVTLDLPGPYDVNRNNSDTVYRNKDTFMFVVTLPYGQPDTEFAMEFYCDESIATCGSSETSDVSGDTNPGIVSSKDVQFTIDSTGRANDLFRRVETRMNTSSSTFAYPIYGLQLLGEKNSMLLEKDITVWTEHGTDAGNKTYQQYLNELKANDIQ